MYIFVYRYLRMLMCLYVCTHTHIDPCTGQKITGLLVCYMRFPVLIHNCNEKCKIPSAREQFKINTGVEISTCSFEAGCQISRAILVRQWELSF